MIALRAAVLALGAALLGLAIFLATAGGRIGPALWLTAVGAMMIIGILFERGRYKPATPSKPGHGWVATDERFVDPQSGETVTVYYQPSTGERRYVGG